MTQPNPPAAAAPLTETEDKQWASFAHLGGIIGILPALVIWLVFKDRGRFTNEEGKEALNFQITLAIAQMAIFVFSSFLAAVTFGVGALLGGLGWVVAIISIILSIMAFMKTKDGIPYRYPFALRLIK